MVINVGGLWERPAAIADGSEVFPSRYSEINFTEPQRSSFRSSNIEVYSSTEEINLEDSGNANNNDTYSKSVSVTEWPECDETSLHCDGTDSSGLKNNFEEVDAHQGSTDFKGGRRDVCDIADHICAGSGGNICAHASRALRVRSSARKDRHSKVNTAKGLRDRRVRLAVSTALQFYDIQDRLEFDQPSQALDWLLTKAKYAIDQLPKPSTISKMNCSTCSTVSKKSMSISEVISTTRADSNLHSPVGADTRENTASSQECSRLEADHIVRGCRAKARERARERAKEKVSGNNTDGRPSGIQIQSRTSLNPLVSSNCAKNNSGLSSISLQNKNFSSALLNSYMQQEGSDAHLNSANNVESLFLYSSHIADKIPAPPSEPPPLQHNVTSSSLSPFIDHYPNAFHLNYQNGKTNNLSEECISTLFDYSSSDIGNVWIKPALISTLIDYSSPETGASACLMNSEVKNRGGINQCTNIARSPSTYVMHYMRNDADSGHEYFNPRIQQRFQGFSFGGE